MSTFQSIQFLQPAVFLENLGVAPSDLIRYTTTILCAAIVQRSHAQCSSHLSTTKTVCAETCAAYAESQVDILTSAKCGLNTDEFDDSVIRQEYELCTIPSNAYHIASCVHGRENEPDSCGFGSDTSALCSFCESRDQDVTDYCCMSINPKTCANSSVVEDVTPKPKESDAPHNSGESLLPRKNSNIRPFIIVILAFSVLLGIMAICGLMGIRYWRRTRSASVRDRVCSLNEGRKENSFQKLNKSDRDMVQSNTASRSMKIPRFASSEARSSETLQATGPSRQTASIMSEMTMNSQEPLIMRDTFSQVLQTTSDISIDSTGLEMTYIDEHSGCTVKVNDLVSCIYNYEPELPDELPLKVGDRLKVTEIFDDGWFKGYGITSPAGGPKAFPSVCVTSYAPSSPKNACCETSCAGPATVRDPAEEPVHTVDGRLSSRYQQGSGHRSSISKFREHVENSP